MDISFFYEKKKALMNKTELINLFDKIKLNLNLLKEYIDDSLKKNSLYISFNGGKDCTASLIILKYYLYCISLNIDFEKEASFTNYVDNQSKEPINNESVKLVYFVKNDVYQEEIDFCFYISKKERIKLLLLNTNYRTGLLFLKNIMTLENILMGIRRDDFPSNKQVSERDIIQHSDGNYPSFYRIYPVFQFSYQEIWILILQTNCEYLNLYNHGYTSIGNKSKTLKNKKLELKAFYEKYKKDMIENDISFITQYIESNKNSSFYLPAYYLEDFESERGYRN
jgi:FAD synthetase